MKPLNERPRELRTLLNPAFCGLIIARAIDGYFTKGNKPMPFSLVILILPLALHERTRNLLKSKPKAYLTSILQNHPELQIGFADRVEALLPHSVEGLGYLYESKVIEIDHNGGVSLDTSLIRKVIKGTDDTKHCQQVAKGVGRKFAEAGDRSTIYTSLGIRP